MPEMQPKRVVLFVQMARPEHCVGTEARDHHVYDEIRGGIEVRFLASDLLAEEAVADVWNRAAADTASDLIGFSDVGALAAVESLRRILAIFDTHPETFAAGFLEMETTEQRTPLSGGICFGSDGMPKTIAASSWGLRSQSCIEIPAPSTAWCLLDRARFAALGSMDPTMAPELALADLCLRARCRGWRTFATGRGKVHLSVSCRQTAPSKRNAQRFAQRWQSAVIVLQRAWEERIALLAQDVWAPQRDEPWEQPPTGHAAKRASAFAEPSRRALRVLVDLSPLSPGGANGGISVFLRELFSAMRSLAHETIQFLFVVSPKLGPEADRFVGADDELWILPDNAPASASRRGQLLAFVDSHLAQRLQADVVYVPLWTSAFATTDLPVISLAADVLHRDFPSTLRPDDAQAREQMFDWMIAHSFRIQCNSQWVLERVRAHFGYPRERMFVVHNAVQNRLRRPNSPVPDERPAFLYPANAWAHKNHTTLLDAYRIYVDAAGTEAWDLVLTGYLDENMRSLRTWVSQQGLDNRVRFPGYVDEEAFQAIWAHCGALVFPSLHEGFGIPLLEAMHLGIPIVTGRHAAIPEVVGDSALYIDTTSPGAIAASMRQVQRDGNLRTRLADAGRARAAQFCLEREATKLLDALNDASDEFVHAGISASWRLDSPRRSDLTEDNCVKPAGKDVLYAVDEPQRWDDPAPTILIRGWCFARKGRAVIGLRVRCGQSEWPSAYGLERPDVFDHFNQADGALRSGFALRIPNTRHRPLPLDFLAELADGRQVQLGRRVLERSPRHP